MPGFVAMMRSLVADSAWLPLKFVVAGKIPQLGHS